MNVLVTGAGGFIGRVVVNKLLAAGHVVDALDSAVLEPSSLPGVRSLIQKDIGVPFSLEGDWDAVFHLAAYNVTHVGDAAAAMYQRVNVLGTRHLIEALKPKRLIFLSTVKVYARHAGVIDETGLIRPAGLYEQSKYDAENICQKLLAPENLVIVRSVNVFGPGQAEKAVVPVFFKKALANEPMDVFGPKRQCLQLLDVEDLAGFLTRILDVPKASGIFNAAPLDVLYLESLVLKIKEKCASSSAILWRNENGEDEIRFLSEKAAKVFGWAPLISLDQSLNRCYEYYGK